jgi:imidazolonepropionase-like amidohydrolase
VGGTVYVDPTAPPVIGGVVLVEDGRITAVGRKSAVRVPREATRLECSGRTVVAGFWNSHVHFIERKWADAAEIPAAELAAQLVDMLTRWGFTSAFDTGSTWENTKRLRGRVESGEIPGPDIRSTGEILFPKGGLPLPAALAALGTMSIDMPEVATPDEARAAATKNLEAGTDGIKIYATSLGWPPAVLPEAAMRAAAEEAHAHRRLVFAHPQTREGLLASVNAGADVLVHTAPNAGPGPFDVAVLAALKAANVAIIPTLKLWRHEFRHERASRREAFVRAGVDQLRSWSEAGGAVLFGTDVGYMDDYDPSDEYTLMSEAGMSFRQILASLTTVPAERFGESARRGRIAAGLDADLVVLRQDPSQNPRGFADVCATIRAGRVLYAAEACQRRR